MTRVSQLNVPSENKLVVHEWCQGHGLNYLDCFVWEVIRLVESKWNEDSRDRTLEKNRLLLSDCPATNKNWNQHTVHTTHQIIGCLIASFIDSLMAKESSMSSIFEFNWFHQWFQTSDLLLMITSEPWYDLILIWLDNFQSLFECDLNTDCVNPVEPSGELCGKTGTEYTIYNIDSYQLPATDTN